MTLIGSNLSTMTNRANPRWIEHNSSVKNGVNKCMFTLYIEKIALITMKGNGLSMVVDKKISPDNDEGQWVVDGPWQSKKE
jgi:hypothetical protein